MGTSCIIRSWVGRAVSLAKWVEKCTEMGGWGYVLSWMDIGAVMSWVGGAVC